MVSTGTCDPAGAAGGDAGHGGGVWRDRTGHEVDLLMEEAGVCSRVMGASKRVAELEDELMSAVQGLVPQYQETRTGEQGEVCAHGCRAA